MIVTNRPNQNKHENDKCLNFPVVGIYMVFSNHFLWSITSVFVIIIHQRGGRKKEKKEAFFIAFSMILLRVLSEKNGLRLVAYVMLLVT